MKAIEHARHERLAAFQARAVEQGLRAREARPRRAALGAMEDGFHEPGAQ